MESTPSTSTGEADPQMPNTRRAYVTRLAPFAKRKDLLKIFAPYNPEPSGTVVLRRRGGNAAFVTFPSPQILAEVLAAAEKRPFYLHKRPIIILKADPWHTPHVSDPNKPLKQPEIERPNPFPGYTPPVKPEIILPMECIALISSFLNFRERILLECVSRRYQEGSRCSFRRITSLSTKDWRWEQPIRDIEFRSVIIRCGPYLRELIFEELEYELPHQLASIALQCSPDLQLLDLHGITIRHTALWEMIENHRDLEHLHIGKSTHPIDEQLSLVVSRNISLKTLCFTKANLTGEGFIWVNNIEHFTLDSCNKLDPCMFVEMMKHQEKLKELYIARCDSLIGGQVLRVMAENTHLKQTLTDVTLSGINLILPDQNLEVVAPATENGDWLILDDGPWETAVSLPAAFANVTDLRIRFCGWVNYIFVQELGLELKKVTFLDLSGCSNIRGLFSLEPLEALSQLKILWLNNLHPSVGGNFLMRLAGLTEFRCRQSLGFSDEDICGLLLHCSETRILDLEGCIQLTRIIIEKAISTQFIRRAYLTMYLGRTNIPFMHVPDYFSTVMIHFEPFSPTLLETTEPIEGTEESEFHGFAQIQGQDP